MEGHRPNCHATEDAAAMFDSDWMSDVSIKHCAEQTTTLQTVAAGDVTCEALHLALNAIHIDLAWHAGVTSADVAMEDLHRAIGLAIQSTSNWRRTR